jgi:predicted enzyme related to lactoylglutathione lyase
MEPVFVNNTKTLVTFISDVISQRVDLLSFKVKRPEENMSDNKTKTYPYRPPKKFPQKDLHGRTRGLSMAYKDLERFKKFYVNVFGWDLFELPSTAGGVTEGSEYPSLLCASGPSYETWEGFIPGHMLAIAHYDPSGKDKPVVSMEVHMDVPLAQTLAEIEAHGGKVIGDKPSENDDWVSGATIMDPAGNIMGLWKCPSSRTWDEPEAQYDREGDNPQP